MKRKASLGLVVGLVGLDEALARALARVLARAGHETVIWHSLGGQPAGEADLLLVDESVLLGGLTASASAPWVYVTTARDRVPGCAGVLRKPFDSEDVLEMVSRFEKAGGRD